MESEYDIFVGYAAPTGNENQVTSSWTQQFINYLTLLMNRFSDRKLNFLAHEDMRIRQTVLSENPARAFSNTAVFVTVLSPEYMKSMSYLKELEDLCIWLQDDKTKTGKKHRIFKVFPQPVPIEEQPEGLRNELCYNFFEINRYNKKPVTFDLSGADSPNEKFWSKLVDLAYDISDVLADMSKSDTSANPVRNSPAVYLAETTFDQSENRDMLKRELQHLGFRILPVVPIPEEAEKSKQAIEQCLDESAAAVHLLGSYYGDFIKNSKLSFIDFQIKTVKDYISSKQNARKPHQIIWIPNDIKPTDQRQSLYLKRLKRDEAQYMTEIIETPFEVFKTILNSRLSELINPPHKTLAEKNKLYVIYEKSSAQRMNDYNETMRARGFDILIHGSNGDENPLGSHINNLLAADAVLIYKGDSTMEWLNSKIRDLVKAPGYGKSKPFRAIEIISSQKTSDKSLLFLKNVPVNWDEEINHDVIRHFLEHLSKK
jgi:penicillin-binding protein-related factor A (putative recombinase)